MRVYLFIVVLAVSLGSGCSTVPTYPTPPVAAKKVERVQTPLDLSKHFTHSVHVAESEIYLAQFGGGSPAAGVFFFGALGAAINVALVDNATIGDGKKDAGGCDRRPQSTNRY